VKTDQRKYNAETRRTQSFAEKLLVRQAFLPVRGRSAKSQRDRHECLSYSRGGEFLLEALRFIVLDEGVDQRGELAVHDFG
jgi:hypothetical protein